jgi:uncharacterized MAPEG superfamily protein
VLRIIYVMMYIAGMAKMRSVVWALALVANISILFLGFK